MDDIERLAALLPGICYPAGVRLVAPSIEGPAFFPGGTGVIVGRDVKNRKAGRTLPRGGVMVVGHNFHNVSSYEVSFARGRKDQCNPTWCNLIPLLEACGQSVERCFLTNALMGLIEGKSATGSVPGHRNNPFRAGCRRVFEASVALQQPRLVLPLGKPAIRFLGEAVPELSHWQRTTSFRKLDEAGAVMRGISLPGCLKSACAVGLIHPSIRYGNLPERVNDFDTTGSGI